MTARKQTASYHFTFLFLKATPTLTITKRISRTSIQQLEAMRQKPGSPVEPTLILSQAWIFHCPGSYNSHWFDLLSRSQQYTPGRASALPKQLENGRGFRIVIWIRRSSTLYEHSLLVLRRIDNTTQIPETPLIRPHYVRNEPRDQ